MVWPQESKYKSIILGKYWPSTELDDDFEIQSLRFFHADFYVLDRFDWRWNILIVLHFPRRLQFPIWSGHEHNVILSVTTHYYTEFKLLFRTNKRRWARPQNSSRRLVSGQSGIPIERDNITAVGLNDGRSLGTRESGRGSGRCARWVWKSIG